MTQLSSLCRLAAVLALAIPASVLATDSATASPPVPARQVASGPFLVFGFRSAEFGMSREQVLAAIQGDFHPAPDDVSEFDNPAELTHIVGVHLAGLPPAPGPCNITYIFGATRHQLMHVNVAWSSDDDLPTDEVRSQMAVAGAQLADALRTLSWGPGMTSSGAAPDGSFVMFAGVDPRHGNVEVQVSGVSIVMPGGKRTVASGPARLRLSYDADLLHPDLAPPAR